MTRDTYAISRKQGLAVTLLLLLSACGDKGLPYDIPGFDFRSHYQTGPQGAPVLLDNTDWWMRLHDPVLDQLVMRGLRHNISLEIARERVIAAEAARKAVPGAATVSPTASANLAGTDSTGVRGVGTARFGLDWILDPYAARRNAERAAGGRADAALAELDAARLLLLFNITQTYVNLRYAQQIVILGQSDLARRERTLALTRKLRDAETATRLDIARSQARVAEVRAQLPGQMAAVTAYLNELTVLTGSAPGALPPDMTSRLTATVSQPVPTLSPQVGIPADLLRNRPDIRIAERTYYAAIADIGVARADLYPRLSLSGAVTLNAIGGNSGTDYFFGPVVQFPSLDHTTERAIVAAREASARQAHAQWRSTVLTAILEVENALVAYDAADRALGAAMRASQLYAETLSLTRDIYKVGDATLGDLIDAEQSLAQANATQADLRRQSALRFVDLNVRLGAGYATN
ncbi:efflux transporter outer membrane subunit [Loktanella sp. M215]|uniref:efflux transporter outer membrane subunit n=1 Tax=Loktanella sp. M215 TaxID=2675431 RepID=UPI001F029A6E|nr:efflux transporter outer membrane subunit [Loktanella sp. M215]MCF7702212.1 efflux transporter outer membrane subunit [Loktanella sp. M215]